jgi:hypothetical protein
VKPWVWGAGIGLGLLAVARQARGSESVNSDGTVSTGAPVTEEIRDLANAIAHAEGFHVAGSIPQRANNPGDLVEPGWTGPTLGAQHISVFSTVEEGWQRLYHQLQIIVTGKSHVYALDDTLEAMGERWTQTQNTSWVANVVESLQSKGYSVDDQSTLREVLSV